LLLTIQPQVKKVREEQTTKAHGLEVKHVIQAYCCNYSHRDKNKTGQSSARMCTVLSIVYIFLPYL